MPEASGYPSSHRLAHSNGNGINLLVIYCRLGELPLSQLAVESYPSTGAGPGGEYKFCIILVLNMILKLVISAWVHCLCEPCAGLLYLVDTALDPLALVNVS